jgi:transposase-like protein
MPRGVPHSPELRKRVIGEVLRGASISLTARKFDLNKSVVSRWVASHPRTDWVVATKPEACDRATIERYLRQTLRAMDRQGLLPPGHALRPPHVPMERYQYAAASEITNRSQGSN